MIKKVKIEFFSIEIPLYFDIIVLLRSRGTAALVDQGLEHLFYLLDFSRECRCKVLSFTYVFIQAIELQISCDFAFAPSTRASIQDEFPVSLANAGYTSNGTTYRMAAW